MVIVIGVIAIILFSIALLSRRRYGILGLSLSAGTLLSSTIARDTSTLMTNFEIPTGSIPYLTAAQILLILLPAFLLVLSGPSYPNRPRAVLGSICFTLLGTLLLLSPISAIVPYDDQSRELFALLSPYTNLAVATLVGISIVDTWVLYKSSQKASKKDSA